jgi:hypothetical protein
LAYGIRAECGSHDKVVSAFVLVVIDEIFCERLTDLAFCPRFRNRDATSVCPMQKPSAVLFQQRSYLSKMAAILPAAPPSGINILE